MPILTLTISPDTHAKLSRLNALEQQLAGMKTQRETAEKLLASTQQAYNDARTATRGTASAIAQAGWANLGELHTKTVRASDEASNLSTAENNAKNEISTLKAAITEELLKVAKIAVGG